MMALENYFAALKLSTGASEFIIVEDRAVRTIEKKMEQPRQTNSNGSTRQASTKFLASGCDQPLSFPMRQRSSLDDSDSSFTFDGSFLFSEKVCRWSPPSALQKHMGLPLQRRVSGGSPPQARRPMFSSASRST